MLNVLSIKHNFVILSFFLLSYAVDYIDMLSHLRVGVSVPVCATFLPNVFSSGML